MTRPRVSLLLTFARRGEEDAILRAKALLEEGHPEARVIAVGTPVSAPVLRSLGLSEVVVFGDGAPARAVLAEVRRSRPRTAAIVYCGPRFEGHLKLEALALLAGVGRVWRVLPDGEARVGRLRLALSVAAKSVQAACYLAIGAAVVEETWLWLRFSERFAGGRHARRP